MFNEQQEEWLGEILDEQVLKNYNKVEDPEGDYLQKMGEHMLAQLSPTGRKYSFYVIDYPVNNAFSLGGSRVYVTRQLIAFLQNEDEFAGLLGHEIGHIVTHQVAIDISRLFRKTLGVTQVSDRKDIFDKWNQLQDIWAKKHLDRDQERSEDEQQIADRIGLYAMTRAGYQPLRLADFFDRLTENKGKTGNFLTDIFGTTNPNSKRVRLLINKAAPMPQECLSPLSAGSSEHFLAWQKAVVGAGRLAGKEQVSGMVKKTTLKPPLRRDQLLQLLRHAVEVAPEIGDLVAPASHQRPHARLEAPAGRGVERPAQAADRPRQVPGEDRAHGEAGGGADHDHAFLTSQSNFIDRVSERVTRRGAGGNKTGDRASNVIMRG